MKFIDRTNELKQLEKYHSLSKKQLFTVAIFGLRRVGKTTLVKEFIKGKKAIYFFVYESKTSVELLREFAGELRNHGIISKLEKIDSWHTFLEVIFKRCNNYVVIFDEFQNFHSVDKTVFSIMQRRCDEHRTNPMNIIVLGSLVGLFKKIFEDKKQPLYGRMSATLNLRPFDLKYSIQALKQLKYAEFEDMLLVYSLFGGFPKYYAAIKQFDLFNTDYLGVTEYLFVQENAPLENEIAAILKQEFGRRSSLYYAILHSIAMGKTKLNEIASNTNMKESSITRHISELEDKFGLIKSLRPLDNKKNARYFIGHPLMLFWFKFIYDKFSEYKLKDTKRVMKSIRENFNSFFGRRFEEICREFLSQMNEGSKLPFAIDYLSNWWGSARVEGERKEIEIDLIALNQKSSQILFVECKWKEQVDVNKVLKTLKEKSKFVNWHRDKRNEYYCIIAKSFKKRIKEKNVLLFDLNDLEKELAVVR